MYAVEFETDVVSEYVRIPNFYQFKNQHVRVILLSDACGCQSKKASHSKYDFSDLVGHLEWQGDALEEQKRIRCEWD